MEMRGAGEMVDVSERDRVWVTSGGTAVSEEIELTGTEVDC